MIDTTKEIYAEGEAANAASRDIKPPASQAGRRIAFKLEGGEESPLHILTINPEDLTITQPSRLTVQQTLGGGWVDSFGPGLRTITIAGNTGWRMKSGNGKDWEKEFESLYKNAFTEWHVQRDKALADGNTDPNSVKLMFIDVLDDLVLYVAPQQFVLRRSKAHPLLMQYSITLLEVGNKKQEELPATPKNTEYAAITALDEAVSTLEEFANDMADMAAGVIAVVAAAFKVVMDVVGKVLRCVSAVLGIIATVGKIIASVTAFIKKLVSAIRNVMAVLSKIRNIFGAIGNLFQRLCSAFNELKCLFAGGLAGVITVENYAAFNGASNCSSTSGGSPLSPLRNVNGLALLPATPRPRLPRPIPAPESASKRASRQALTQAKARQKAAERVRDSALGTYTFVVNIAGAVVTAEEQARIDYRKAALDAANLELGEANRALSVATVTFATA